LGRNSGQPFFVRKRKTSHKERKEHEGIRDFCPLAALLRKFASPLRALCPFVFSVWKMQK